MEQDKVGTYPTRNARILSIPEAGLAKLAREILDSEFKPTVTEDQVDPEIGYDYDAEDARGRL